jgi:hypothetical protein
LPRAHRARARSAWALDPSAALLDLWRTGYVLSALDGAGMTLRAPQL